MNDELQIQENEQVDDQRADDAPVVEQETVKPEWSAEDAEEAKAFGWKSPDEWTGDIPAGYIDDPRRYLERAENFRPFKALKARLETTESTYAERIRKLEAVSDQALQAQRQQYERDLESIRARKREAVENADVDQYQALEKQESSMRPPAAPQQEQFGQREFNEYASSENGAWLKNPLLQETGQKLVDAAMKAGMLLSTPQAQFEYAETEIRKMYPAYFPSKQTAPEPKPAPQQRVDGGGLAGGAGQGGAFAKLPQEAKTAFKKFAGEGLFKDNEEDRKRYADDYNAA